MLNCLKEPNLLDNHLILDIGQYTLNWLLLKFHEYVNKLPETSRFKALSLRIMLFVYYKQIIPYLQLFREDRSIAV